MLLIFGLQALSSIVFVSLEQFMILESATCILLLNQQEHHHHLNRNFDLVVGNLLVESHGLLRLVSLDQTIAGDAGSK